VAIEVAILSRATARAATSNKDSGKNSFETTGMNNAEI
jgi:hypothetical protein